MHGRCFVIAECCSSWRFNNESQHLENAYRMIQAAKDCGVDAAKFQWTSNPVAMSKRRNDNEPKNYEILNYPFFWLDMLKKKCDEVGIEFMVTVFLTKDFPLIEQFVRRFKIASAESNDEQFIHAHEKYDKPVIISYGFGSRPNPLWKVPDSWKLLHCVVSYPAPLEQINIGRVSLMHGFSDHSTSTLIGALAVVAGASVIEKHVKLWDTPETNPDFPHSLLLEKYQHHPGARVGDHHNSDFAIYVRNIREAELALGSGKNKMMPCEEINLGRRVKP